MNPLEPPAAVNPNTDRWPFVKPLAVTVGNGSTVHGSIGPLTACGRVWRGQLAADIPPLVNCRACLPVLDKRDAYDRRLKYSVLVSYEQDAFAAGVVVAEATAWRKLWAAGEYDQLN